MVTPMECDSSAKATKYEINFEFVAKNLLSRYKTPTYSASKTLGNLSWSIMIQPICVGSRRTSSQYEFYLICDGEAENSSWCYNIDAELTAVSHDTNNKNAVKKTRDVLYPKATKWRSNYLMLQWDDIKPKWPYITNNSITLHAHVIAEYVPLGSVNWKQMRLNPVKLDLSQTDYRSEATFDFVVENISKVETAIYSPPCMIRNLPWKIRIEPRLENVSDPNSAKTLSFSFACNGEPGNFLWSCSVSAELMVVSQKAGVQNFVKSMKQLYASKNSSWGYPKFMAWNDLLNPERGFIINDKVIFRAHVVAETPKGVSWGFASLESVGTKSYMNSLLQTLYFTKQFRKAVYKIPTKNDDDTNVTLALQKVFFDLQTESTAVDVKQFTKSLNCEALGLFAPHDMQKFVQILFEKLESRMKCTPVEGTVSKLFSGKMKSFITFNNVKYMTEKSEIFYNIQLNVNDKNNINRAFREFVPPEWNASEPNSQNFKGGVVFESFPPILHIHLARFHRDPLTDCCVKFNDRFEFYEKLHLNPCFHRPEPNPINYTLHAVLAHGGDYDGDQYVVFIDSKCDGKWCKFVDENVSKSSKQEAIESNYGGQVKNSTNAYMLVYIHDDELKNVLADVTMKDIPDELKTRFEKERKTSKSVDSNDQYITMNVFWEESPKTERYSVNQSPIRIFKMKESTTIEQILTMLSKSFNCPLNHIKIKPFNLNENLTYTCVNFDVSAEKSKQIGNITRSVWNVFFSVFS